MMTPKDLIDHASATFARCVDVMKKKNSDYSGHEENAFRNFMLVEQMGISSVEAGIAVRLSDKFSRLTNLLRKDPAVVEEKLEDTIEDAINYLVILHAYVSDKRKLKKEV